MGVKAKLALIVILAALAVFAAFQIYAYVAPKQQGVGFRITVVHEDGSIDVYDSRDYPSAVLINPRTGLPVSRVQVELYIVPVFQGKIDSYAVQGSLKMQIIEVSTGKVCSERTAPIMQMFSPQLESGRAVVISSSTVEASALESLYSGWKEGCEYRFIYTCEDLSMTVQFSGGSSQTVKASNLPASAAVNFQYKSGIMQNLQVQFNIVV